MATNRVTAIFTVAALYLAAFLAVALVAAGEPGLDWERSLIIWLRSAANPEQWPQLAYLARDLTAMGGRTLLLLWILSTSALLWAGRLHRCSLFVLVAGTIGLGVAPLIKAMIGRARPDLVEHLVPAASPAFPSAHAMNAMLVYLLLALVVSRLQGAGSVSRVLLALALTLAGLVGLTRVYLGVHWPGDVLAGWALGAAWSTAWVGWAVHRGWLR